jgi:hypothetical protein
MKMIDPLSVLVATPSHDYKVEGVYAGGLAACASAHLFGNIAFLGNTPVRLARNLLVGGFLRSQYQWLIFIDADIGFSAKDMALLMDYPPVANGQMGLVAENNPEGTTLDDDGHALIVCAEYSKKIDTGEAARLGMGFCRLSKKAFQLMIDARDEENEPRVGDFLHNNDVVYDFFPEGPAFGHNWLGEDTGFFHVARLCGIQPRIEQRTSLVHVGRKLFTYLPPAIPLESQLMRLGGDAANT